MKFITRELHDAMQGNLTDEEERARTRQWERACNAYRAQLDVIRSHLPPGMRRFADTTLHDGVVRSVDLKPHELIMVIDATNCPWGPQGTYELKFVGVREVEGTSSLVEDDWLYEEVHLHDAGRFEYRILFEESDFRVVADELVVNKIS